MKADYAVARAGDLGGTGDALVRAQDKIATADVDSQLAELKAKLAASPATPELPSGDSPPASPAKDSNP